MIPRAEQDEKNEEKERGRERDVLVGCGKVGGTCEGEADGEGKTGAGTALPDYCYNNFYYNYDYYDYYYYFVLLQTYGAYRVRAY